MLFLAIPEGMNFGYADLMNMEHTDRIIWIDRLNEHIKEKQKAIDAAKNK